MSHGKLIDSNGSIKINNEIVNNADKWNNLLSIFEWNGHQFNIVNWATFMNRLGRNRKSEIFRLKKNPRYKNAISSIAEIFVSNSIREICSVRHMSNIVHALAKLDEPIKVILDRVEKESEWIINNGEPQHISNIAWAFAKLNVPAPNFFKLVDEDASRIIGNGTPQAISNTAWAFAKLSVPAPNFFKLVDEDASKIIRNGTPQNISNTAWAFATFSIPAPNFFKLVEEDASKIIRNGKPQEISNTAWAFAKLSVPAPNFFKLVVEDAFKIIRNGTPQNISNTAWAFATLSIPAPNFFKLVEKDASKIITNGKPQEISNTTWAFAELGYDSIHLPKLIDDSSAQLMKGMNSQAIANVALAFAKLDYKSNHYFNVLENNIDAFLRSMNNQDICNILWSLAILDLMDQNKMLLGVLWRKAISKDPSEFHDDNLYQLAQVHVHAKANSIDLKQLPTSLQSRIDKSVWHADVNSSRSENEYSKLLQEIGFNHEREVSPFDDSSYGNMLLIDYACRDRMVAIEFDGPFHFLTNLKEGALPNHDKKNGATKAKRRLLKRLGWKFISISYMEDVCVNKKGQNKARELKKEYLKQKLRKVSVVL